MPKNKAEKQDVTIVTNFNKIEHRRVSIIVVGPGLIVNS